MRQPTQPPAQLAHMYVMAGFVSSSDAMCALSSRTGILHSTLKPLSDTCAPATRGAGRPPERRLEVEHYDCGMKVLDVALPHILHQQGRWVGGVQVCEQGRCLLRTSTRYGMMAAQSAPTSTRWQVVLAPCTLQGRLESVIWG